jgi:hypothetical protein
MKEGKTVEKGEGRKDGGGRKERKEGRGGK